MGSSQEAVRLPKQEIAALGAVAQNNSDESLVMEGLVGKCPTAIVKLAGVPVKCVLDTGGQTSLMTNEIYSTHLVSNVKNLDSVSQFVRVVGANDLSIPVVGVVDVPLEVSGHQMDALLLIRGGTSVSRRSACPVLLGCNVLRRIVPFISPETSCPGWQSVLPILRLDSQKVEVEHSQDLVTCSGVALVTTGVGWETIPAASLQVLQCSLELCEFSRGGETEQAISNKQLSVLLEACDSDSDHVEMVHIVEGCQDVAPDKTVTVVVRNDSGRQVSLPPFSKVCQACAVFGMNEVVVQSKGSEIDVRLQEVVVHELSPQAKPKVADLSCRSVECSESLQDPLPEGLWIGPLTSKQTYQVKELLSRRSQAFSEGPLDLGNCNLIPHQIKLKDDRPVNLPFRRVPPHLIEEVREQIQGLLDKGIIKKSSSNYASRIVPVRKRDGSLRLCVDYRGRFAIPSPCHALRSPWRC